MPKKDSEDRQKALEEMHDARQGKNSGQGYGANSYQKNPAYGGGNHSSSQGHADFDNANNSNKNRR